MRDQKICWGLAGLVSSCHVYVLVGRGLNNSGRFSWLYFPFVSHEVARIHAHSHQGKSGPLALNGRHGIGHGIFKVFCLFLKLQIGNAIYCLLI